MQAESLEALEKASVAPAQARAIVRAIEIEIAGAKDSLATKHDVVLLRQDLDFLRRDLSALRQDFDVLRQSFDVLKQDVAALKQSFGVLTQDVAALKQSFDVLKQDNALLRQDFVVLRRDFDGLKVELGAALAKVGGELHAEIHRAVSGSTRQMYMALLGQMAVTLGFFYFVVTQLR